MKRAYPSGAVKSKKINKREENLSKEFWTFDKLGWNKETNPMIDIISMHDASGIHAWVGMYRGGGGALQCYLSRGPLPLTGCLHYFNKK